VGIFRERDDRRLDRRLRGLRQEPREELIESIALQVGERRPRAWSRVAFAGALATLVLGTFASFGGVSYAASGAKHTLKAVATTTHVQSSAAKQYKPKVVAHVGVKHAAVARTHPLNAAVKAQTLPFTGVSLVWTAVGGFVLLLLGFALRRRERHR
jgi:hypothetical protein